VGRINGGERVAADPRNPFASLVFSSPVGTWSLANSGWSGFI